MLHSRFSQGHKIGNIADPVFLMFHSSFVTDGASKCEIMYQ